MMYTIISCLLILGTKRCMLYFMLVFGEPKCKNHVREFMNSVRFVNMLNTAERHPQVYWNPYLLLIEGLYHGKWTLSKDYLYVQMAVTLFSPVLIVLPSTLS